MKKVLGIVIIVLIIVNIVFWGIVDIRKIVGVAENNEFKVKYIIFFNNHEIIKIKKIYIYKDKINSKNKFNKICELNNYLTTENKINAKLKGKKVIINVSINDFKSEFNILCFDENDVIDVLNQNGYSTNAYLNYTRLWEKIKQKMQIGEYSDNIKFKKVSNETM